MTGAPVRCRLPATFAPIDLASAGGPPALREFTRQLLAARARYAAVFVLPPGRPGYFAITEPVGTPTALDALADALATVPGCDVRVAELPCGPAVTCTEYAWAATGPTDRVDVVQEHAFVLHPAARQVVAFTLGTQGTERRPEHARLFTEILYTVTLEAMPRTPLHAT